MKKKHSQIVLYSTPNGSANLQVQIDDETVWLSQKQMSELFQKDVRTINEHIQNIFTEGELQKKATIRKSRIVQKEAGRNVEREVDFYNLDAIISVGYRVKSLQGTRFRIWATQTLRQHILEGYTINKSRLVENRDAFMQAVADVRELTPTGTEITTDQVLGLISTFANTWFSLDAFDRGAFGKTNTTRKKVAITAQKLLSAVATLKSELSAKGQASKLFASEREKGSFAGIVGNVMQSFDGQDVYPTLEEKAAHLLYFIVKNHPFVDGNKRTGAFAFVWFLRRVGALNPQQISPEALTALTLLVASSNPQDKDKMIGLILLLLGAGAEKKGKK